MLKKPKCKLVGKDGNVLNLMGLVRNALNRVGLRKAAAEMSQRVFVCGSYDEALQIFMEYVDVY